MRGMKLTTSLFAVSFLSAVAAGWAQLDADAPTDGPAGKPALRDVTIDGHAMHLAVDRDRVVAGDQVHVRLAMTDAPRKGLDVRVTLLEQVSQPMARMVPPPRKVEEQIVHLGAEARTLAFTLAGPAAGGDPIRAAGRATQYTVAVRSARKHGGTGGAAIPVFAYQPQAYAITIDPPPPGAEGTPVDLTVHVKSLVDKPLTAIQLGASSSFAKLVDAPTIATLAPGARSPPSTSTASGSAPRRRRRPSSRSTARPRTAARPTTRLTIDRKTGMATAVPPGRALLP